MAATRLRLVGSIALFLAAAACSKHETAAPAATREKSPAAAVTPQATTRAVCAMVTAADMSSIVGTTVSSEGEEGGGSTTCRYRAGERSSPYVEIKIDWGGGGAAMMASGILRRLEPGISNRLAGLGDEASAAGPVLMVRTGEDLVNLTLWGVEDDVAAAKRIISLIRPRMGPSAQAKAAEGGSGDGKDRASDSGSNDLAKAGQLVSGLLSGLAEQNERSRTSGAAGGNASANSPARSAPADEAAFGPATGPPVRIPLVAGLTLVGAEHEPGRGDYEPIVTIAGVTSDTVSTVFSANLPEGTRLVVDRHVRRDDLRQARGYRSWYEPDDPPVFAGTTAFSVSAVVLADLKTKGQAEVVRMNPDASPLAAIANLVTGNTKAPEHPGTLKRIEPHAVAFPVLLNDEPAELPAIHARGTFDDATIDFHVLDDPDNPLVLRVAGGSTGRIVRIAFPTTATTPIEEKLKKDSRVELHGIYFDFAKATIRPESEPVLREIASALTHNPSWKINVEGHTDSVGGDALNLDLSRRRADAVKQALIDRYGLPAANLTTAGFGASHPNAPNDTLSGRARNRRVELVRQ